MKRIWFLILLSIFTISISGCGESMFGVGGNDQSPEARESVVKKAFMDKDYDKILSVYPSKDYTTFTDKDAYNIVAAYLGKGGFDILNGVDMFLGDSNSSNTGDMYSTFYTLIGIKSFENDKIFSVKNFFDTAANICNTVTCTRVGGQMQLNQDNTSSCNIPIDNTTIIDKKIGFVCSLTGGFGTVTNLSNTVMLLAEKANITDVGDLTSQAGIQRIAEEISKQDTHKLQTTIESLTDDELKDLANTLNTLDGNLSAMEGIVGDTGAQEVLQDLKGSDGKFTVESIKTGLSTYLQGTN